MSCVFIIIHVRAEEQTRLFSLDLDIVIYIYCPHYPNHADKDPPHYYISLKNKYDVQSLDFYSCCITHAVA